jgi:hypothetical protein
MQTMVQYGSTVVRLASTSMQRPPWHPPEIAAAHGVPTGSPHTPLVQNDPGQSTSDRQRSRHVRVEKLHSWVGAQSVFSEHSMQPSAK